MSQRKQYSQDASHRMFSCYIPSTVGLVLEEKGRNADEKYARKVECIETCKSTLTDIKILDLSASYFLPSRPPL